MSEETNREDAAEWLRLADLDLRAGEKALAGDDPLPGDACFHAQQAAEKFLKAFLVSQGTHPRRTHDLELLLEECAEFEPDFRSLAAVAETLTPFAIETRYPVGSPEYSYDEAREALSLAAKIGAFVRPRLR